MSLTILFTYLKIILLQYFQFLALATIRSIQMDLSHFLFNPHVVKYQ